MTGRYFLGILLLVVAGVCCAQAESEKKAHAENAADTPPNIVIYLVDTLRADRLNCYGYEKHETSPFLDKLAEDGVLFENGTAAAPWTLPSITSMFTSSWLHEHKTLGTFDRLPDSWDTLTLRLRRLDYQTYTQFATGFLAREFNIHRGFQYYQRVRPDGATVTRGLAQTGLTEPFFYYIHTVEPHNPYRFAPMHTPGFKNVSQKIRRRMHTDMRRYKKAGEYDYRKKLPLGTNDLTDKQDAALVYLRELIDEWNELYDASVRFADHNLESIVDVFKRRGVWDNTLIIFIADHGEEYDEHGGWLHDQSVYNELMHVPFVVRFPNNEYGGQRFKQPVSLIDIMPTVLDYVGHPEMSKDDRGRSLMPLIRGEVEDDYESLCIPGMRINTTRYYRPWEKTRGTTNILIRSGPWKGIWNVELDTMELYNLEQDYGEQSDVHAKHPELVKRMRAFAEEWYEETGKRAATTKSEASGDLSEGTLEALRMLGYVEGEDEEDADTAPGDESEASGGDGE